ncbi:hypothetical protein AVEN_199847-1 [Araneus ventricosus]|uniref:Uncharacterized protein n=1 Tax=Araneus ventricosus TaxID=182803 RepID=A0A4Y2DTR1_ARAVE|nr:hypothetical protein AVEN_199847-1 [Araneus ventricosus]
MARRFPIQGFVTFILMINFKKLLRLTVTVEWKHGLGISDGQEVVDRRFRLTKESCSGFESQGMSGVSKECTYFCSGKAADFPRACLEELISGFESLARKKRGKDASREFAFAVSLPVEKLSDNISDIAHRKCKF